jgi:phage/plasmid-associated DNA primase
MDTFAQEILNALPKTMKGRDSRNYYTKPKSALKDILNCKSKNVRLVRNKKTGKKEHIESMAQYNKLYDSGILDEERITTWKTNAVQYFTTYDKSSPFKKDGEVIYKPVDERFYVIDFDDFVNIQLLPRFMKEKGFFTLSNSGKIHYYFKCDEDIRSLLGNKVMTYQNIHEEMFDDIDLKEMIYEMNCGSIYFPQVPTDANMFVSTCELKRLLIPVDSKEIKKIETELLPYENDIDKWKQFMWLCVAENKSWDGWNKMCYIMPEGKEYEDLFVEWSSQGYNALESECRNKFQKTRHIGSWGAIIKLAKFYNEELVSDVMHDLKIDGSRKWVECGNVGVANIFYRLNKDNFIYKVEDELWYGLSPNGRWKALSKKNNGLINVFYESVFPVIKQLHNDVMEEYNFHLQNKGKDEEIDEELENRVKNISTIKRRICEVKFQTDSVKFASAKFNRNDMKFDDNPYLVGFDNGVWDFSQKLFRPYMSEDYITMSVGYDWNEENANDEEKAKELEALIKQVFHEETIIKFYKETMARSLIGICSQKFIIANGSGGNSKGILIEGMGLSTFGDYGYNMPTTIITGEKKSGPNPELAKCHRKRFICCKEPSAKKKLDNASVKDLTGGGQVNARLLHSNNTETVLCGTLFMETNPKLNWLEEPSQAEVRRVVLIPFKSTFVENKDEVNEERRVYLQNPKYATDEWKQSVRLPFFNMLKNILLKNEVSLTVETPSFLKEKTEKYLSRGIQVLDFIDEEFIKLDKEGIKKQNETGEGVLSLSVFFEMFKMSEYYGFLSRDEKQNAKKSMEELFETNTFVKKYYSPRFRNSPDRMIDIKRAVVGLKRKNKEERDEFYDEGVESNYGKPPI